MTKWQIFRQIRREKIFVFFKIHPTVELGLGARRMAPVAIYENMLVWCLNFGGQIALTAA